MSLEKCLIISEEAENLHWVEAHLPKSLEMKTSIGALKGIEEIKQTSFDLILCDLDLLEISGLDVLQIAKKIHPDCIFIAFCSSANLHKAHTAIRLGALHYILKPLTSEGLEAALEKASEHILLLEENAFLRKEMSYHPSQGKMPLIAESPVMKSLLEDVSKIAKSNASVFIIGESGTGKEVISNAIHHLSHRSHKPFIRVNCAAIPEPLLESEFFGHEKGSFTGAIQKRIGRFELADNGTLLLDEISEVPLELQPKLLRVIQEQEFERVGGIKPIKVDVRLISTSNRNMQEAIEKKTFREDLYFRLHVVPLHLPPLRERQEDIIPLAEYFLKNLCAENLLHAKHLSAGAKEKLLNYYWPGNVRELANIIERTVVMHSGEEIKTDEVKLELACPIPKLSKSAPSFTTLAELEKNHILSTLELLENNKTKAAKTLGISLRTLRNKIKIYQSF